MAIDGGVALAGIVIQVQELSVSAPLRVLGDPETWKLDLRGLAVGYSASGVSIAGGLAKVELPGGMKYDGLLAVQVADKGLTAIGSYAKPRTRKVNTRPWFRLRGAVDPIGGPPYLFVTGLVGGFRIRPPPGGPSHRGGHPTFRSCPR